MVPKKKALGYKTKAFRTENTIPMNELLAFTALVLALVIFAAKVK